MVFIMLVIFILTVGYLLSLFSACFRHGGIMTVFENCTVVVDVKNVPYKEKKKLKLALLHNGGNISYVINREVRSAHHYFLNNYYMIVFLIKTKSSYTNDCFSSSWVS